MPVEVHYKTNKFIPTVKKGSCTKRVSSLMTVLKSPAATVSVLAYQSVHVGEEGTMHYIAYEIVLLAALSNARHIAT